MVQSNSRVVVLCILRPKNCIIICFPPLHNALWSYIDLLEIQRKTFCLFPTHIPQCSGKHGRNSHLTHGGSPTLSLASHFKAALTSHQCNLYLDQSEVTCEKTTLAKMGKWGQGLVSSGCPVCLRSVYPMEAVMAADRTPYHKVNNFCLFKYQVKLAI